MKTIQAVEQHISPQEMAERVRHYHEFMEPYIKAAARIFGMSASPQYLMADGNLAERIYTPDERLLLDRIDELGRMHMARLGLASPSGER